MSVGYSQPEALIHDDLKKEFRSAAAELALINVPSVAAVGYAVKKFGESAQNKATGLMEASDMGFTLGVIATEKLDRSGKNTLALRLRQLFALGHVATATTGVYLGIQDIINDTQPETGNMVVAGSVAGASIVSLVRDKSRAKRAKIMTEQHLETVNENLKAEAVQAQAYHGLDADLVSDMKRTNLAEAVGGLLAISAQAFISFGSAAVTVAYSATVAGIMGRNFMRNQQVYRQFNNK